VLQDIQDHKEQQVQQDQQGLQAQSAQQERWVQQVLLEHQVQRGLLVLLAHWDILAALATPERPVQQVLQAYLDILDPRELQVLQASRDILEV
jgi:hypothetical protein